VFGIENIESMKFIHGSKTHISKEKANQLSGYDAKSGDVLISRSGTVGEVCVVPEDVGAAIISTNLMRITLAPNGLVPKFFCFLLNGSPFVLKQVSELCKGSTREFLNQEILASIFFPLPPLAEQKVIVEEFERYQSQIDQLVNENNHNNTCCFLLRQSILQRAFEGKLVPQDPNDEPAALLLERIRAERAVHAPKRGKRTNGI